MATRNASSPAYSDGMLYLANLEPGQVLGLNAKNGVQPLEAPLPGRTESSPVVVGNKVIVGCECGTLFAFDKKTGKTLWEADLPGQIKAAPAVSEGVAYVGDYSGTMSAVRVNDGSIKWQSSSRGRAQRRRLLRHRRRRLRPRLRGLQGRPHLQLREGDRRPRLEPDDRRRGLRGGRRRRHARDRAHRLLRRLRRQQFYALDARTGDERWSADAGGSVIGAASLIGETVYVANLQTTETDAFNAANGDKVWSFRDGAYNPVISDGKRLYLTGYKTIYSLEPVTGKPQARRRRRSKQKSSAEEGLESEPDRDPACAHPLLRLGDGVLAVVEDRGAEDRVGVPVARSPRPGGRARRRRRRRSPGR